MAQPLDAISSFIDGRVRLRHAALKQPGLMQAACTFLEGVEGVTAVQGNPVTGSLLIFYDAEKLSRDELLEIAAQGAAFFGQEPVGAEKKENACDTLRHVIFGRRASRIFNRVLLASLLCSLGGAACGAGAVHKVAGTVFSLACLQHVAAHRKLL